MPEQPDELIRVFRMVMVNMNTGRECAPPWYMEVRDLEPVIPTEVGYGRWVIPTLVAHSELGNFAVDLEQSHA